MDKYLENINKAIKEGRIEFATETAKSCLDPHSHLYERELDQGIYPPVFGEYNTRGLSKQAQSLLEELLINESKHFRVLELGAGSGRAAYDIYSIAKSYNCTVSIDTVALTPFAPNYRLSCSFANMVECFANYYSEIDPSKQVKWIEDTLYFYYQMYKWKVDKKISPFSMLEKSDHMIIINEAKKRPWGLPIISAFELQRLGFNFFELCPDYVSKQYIGNLSDNKLIYGDKYDFVHDEWGALHYSLRYEDDLSAQKELIRNLLSTMSDKSFFFISNLRENKVELFNDYESANLSINTRIIDSKSVEMIIEK